jgi:hypothetical protein
MKGGEREEGRREMEKEDLERLRERRKDKFEKRGERREENKGGDKEKKREKEMREKVIERRMEREKRERRGKIIGRTERLILAKKRVEACKLTKSERRGMRETEIRKKVIREGREKL